MRTKRPPNRAKDSMVGGDLYPPAPVVIQKRNWLILKLESFLKKLVLIFLKKVSFQFSALFLFPRYYSHRLSSLDHSLS